jgi:hypothetical protein
MWRFTCLPQTPYDFLYPFKPLFRCTQARHFVIFCWLLVAIIRDPGTWSCPCRLRLMFRDRSRTVCVVSISRSSALETRFHPFFHASWPTSERTSTAAFHAHQAAPFLRPSEAVATVARDRGAPL